MPRIAIDQTKDDFRLNGCRIKRLEMVECKATFCLQHGKRIVLDDFIGEIYIDLEISCPDCRREPQFQWYQTPTH
jgi:hypothetical protein